MAELDRSALAESDIAMDIYLSGWASGVKSTLLNGTDAPDDVAEQLAHDAVAHVQGDPIAIAQLRQVIHDIVYDTDDAPTHVTAYGSDAPDA